MSVVIRFQPTRSTCSLMLSMLFFSPSPVTLSGRGFCKRTEARTFFDRSSLLQTSGLRRSSCDALESFCTPLEPHRFLLCRYVLSLSPRAVSRDVRRVREARARLRCGELVGSPEEDVFSCSFFFLSSQCLSLAGQLQDFCSRRATFYLRNGEGGRGILYCCL